METETSSGASNAHAQRSPSTLPPQPRRPEERAAESIALLVDPLLELCPSLHSIQSLCLLPVNNLPGKDETFRRKRLEKAILRAASNGDVELLSWMCYMKDASLGEGARPEVRAMEGVDWSTLRDEEGSGPLNLAASSGHADIVQLLVQHGVDVDERDAVGWTPLMWATNCSNLPLVSFLLSHGANIEAKSFKGATCEDFILSSCSEVDTTRSSEAGPSRLSYSATPQRPLSPHSSDRQLIADLIFEHQQTIQKEKTEKASKVRQRLRSLTSGSNSSGSLDSENESANPSLQPSPLIGNNSTSPSSRPSRSTMRRLIGRNERTQLAEAELRARELAEGRRRALLDVAVMMQVDYSDLIGGSPAQVEFVPSKRVKERSKRQKGLKGKQTHSGLASGCGAIEVGIDPLSMEFDFDIVRPDQMLVIGETQVDSLLHKLINEAKPVRAPWIARSKSANVLYLCIRYACSLPDEALLEELVFGAVDRIEAVLYAHPTEMTYLAFWLYNCMLLLHYLKRDKVLFESESMQEYHSLMADLINEIYVFVIRDMERRIDKVIDTAILDHNSIPGFEDVRFEGEWNFMKTLTGSVKRANQSGGSSSPTPKRPLSQLFSSDQIPPSLPSTPSRKGAPSISILPSTPNRASFSELREPSHDASASDLLAKPMPRTITLLLTSTLHILQLYEVNPSVIIQALSQVFYWVGCELFNRVISQRKYLSKSKAMQIRLNISALEDWVKTNALPLSIVNLHLSRLNQLISWLLCQSSLIEFDGLIATIQGLKELNPNQMKQVIKNYKYEVGETRINTECLAYLDQVQMDWEKRQEQEVMERNRPGHSRGGTITEREPSGRHENKDDEDSQASDVEEKDTQEEQAGQNSNQDDTVNSATSQKTTKDQGQHQEKTHRRAKEIQASIDRLFEAGQSMINYVPPASLTVERGDAMTTMLLNSRDMLPFALPSQTHALIVSPGDAFGFGRGHFMGTGTPSLKSFRNGSLLGSHNSGLSSRNGSIASPMLGSSKASSETSSRCSSSQRSQASGTSSVGSRLYPQGKGLAAGSYWQPVPILPEDTLDEIQSLMKKAEQDYRYSNVRRNSLDSRLSDAALQSPILSTEPAFTRSPFFDQEPLDPSRLSPHKVASTDLSYASPPT